MTDVLSQRQHEFQHDGPWLIVTAEDQPTFGWADPSFHNLWPCQIFHPFDVRCTDKALKVMKCLRILRNLTYLFAVQKLGTQPFHSDVDGFTEVRSAVIRRLIWFTVVDKIRLGLLQNLTGHGQIPFKHREIRGMWERNRNRTKPYKICDVLIKLWHWLICTTVFKQCSSSKPTFPAFKNPTAWHGLISRWPSSGPEKAQRNGELWRMAYSITGPLQVASQKHPKTILFCRDMKLIDGIWWNVGHVEFNRFSGFCRV